MENEILLSVSNVSKRYRLKEVLNDISFEVSKGDIVGLVGANGCGKSTLLSILSGASKADKGTVYINGKKATKKVMSKYIGYVPQENPLFENLSVRDNLKLWCSEAGIDDKGKTMDELIDTFSLKEYQKFSINKLSGGLKKRVSIACALAANPPILILDEPGAALDVIFKEEIKYYLVDYVKSGGTVIITSHEENELSLCNRMLLIKNTKLTEIPVTYKSNDLMRLISESDDYNEKDIL